MMLAYNVFNFCTTMSCCRNFPQYLRNFFSVSFFKHFTVRKVLSMMEDDATFDQATIDWAQKYPLLLLLLLLVVVVV